MSESIDPTVLADGGPPCSTHPDAPHGFNRDSSHSYGRYSCDCEGWSPDMSPDSSAEKVREDIENNQPVRHLARARAEQVQGDTMAAWRENLSQEMYATGDCVLAWVNQGDLLAKPADPEPNLKQNEELIALRRACRRAVVALAHASTKSKMYNEAYEELAQVVSQILVAERVEAGYVALVEPSAGSPAFQEQSAAEAKPGEILAHLNQMQRLLTWNRAQPKPLIAIGMEYEVAAAAIDLYGNAGDENANHENSQDRNREVPLHPFALVWDRSFDGEGLSLAIWDGCDYQFSDGDCFARDGNTLDGHPASFLTQHQLETALVTRTEIDSRFAGLYSEIEAAIANTQSTIDSVRQLTGEAVEKPESAIEGWWVGFPDGSSRVYPAENCPIENFKKAGAVCRALGFIEQPDSANKDAA